MKPIGVLLLLLTASALPAQFLQGPGVPAGYFKVKKIGGYSFSLNRGSGFYNPYYGAFSPGIVRSSFTQIIVQQPPIIIAQPAGLFPEDAINPLAPLAGRLIGPPPDDDPGPPPMPMEEPPLPGRDAGVFKPLDPDNRDRARLPVAPAPPPPDRLLRPRAPDADPRVESQRRANMGKEAFRNGEYGRAAERFRQAADLTPNSPLPLFLLGQAHLALGNHRRAFDALQIGLRLDPDWPRQPFRPIELYGDNVTDYADHTQLLEDLLAAAPDDPLLLFLTGYQFWFDGRRDEAKLLLQRAAPSLPDPSLADRFLQALPPADVL